MNFDEKELTYLNLYKGNDVEKLEIFCQNSIPNALNKKLLPFANLYFSHTQINSLVNFLFTNDLELLDNICIKTDIDNTLDMVFTLSNIACRYALNNPLHVATLYRAEHKKNFKNYALGNMSLSFNSTSKKKSETSVFQDDDTINLKVNTSGFVPYIPVDVILKSGVFSDEAEILFPPCIKCIVNSNDNENKVTFTDDHILNGEDNVSQIIPKIKELYNNIKERFNEELYECQKKKIVSDNLKKYCEIVRTYMFINLRNMYNYYSHMNKIFNEFNIEPNQASHKGVSR